MAYVGNPIDTQNTFQSLVGKRFNGDGSTTDFTLDVAPSSTLDIEVFVGNVRQDPNSAYTLSGTTLTFTGAPPSGTNNIYVVHQAKSVGTIDVPADAVKADNLNSAVLTGQTDIGGAIADADLFLIDDGAGGTLRKTAASRIKTYVGSAVTVLNNATANELVTVGSTTTELDAEANLTFDGGTLTVKDDASGSTTETLVVTNGTSANPSYANLVFKTGGNTTGCFIKGVQASSGNDGRLEFYVNNSGTSTEAMRMNYLGRVYIGDTSSSGYNGAVWKDADGISFYRPTSTGGNGILLFYSDANSTKGNVGYYTANGGLANYQSNNVNLSDERLKKDIVDCPSTWDKIKNLKVRNFKYKNDTDEKVVTGLIAQEVETVDANLVNSENGLYGYEKEQEDGKFKQIYTTDLYHQMLKTLQEAQTKIETLETEMTALKARVTTLEE